MAPLARLELQPWPTVVIEWGCAAFATVFVALRVYQRHAFPRKRPLSKGPHLSKFSHRIHKPRLLSSSDIMVIITMLCFLATISLDTTIVAMGFNNPKLELDPHGGPHSIFSYLSATKMRSLLQILWISSVPYYLSLWGIKISLLMFYYTLFPLTMPYLRVALNFTTVVVLCTLCVVQLVNLFWCWPADRNWQWEKRPDEMCLAYYQFTPYAITVGCHVGTELLVFSLPFPLLSSLHLSPRRKRTLIAVFVTGFAGVCVSIGRVVCVTTEPAKKPRSPPAVIGICQAWAALEMAVGVIVVCVPSFKTLCARLIEGDKPLPPIERHERKRTGDPDEVFGCMGVGIAMGKHDDEDNWVEKQKVISFGPQGGLYPGSLRPKDEDALSECTTIRPSTRGSHTPSGKEEYPDYDWIEKGPPRVVVEREKGFGTYGMRI